MPTQTQWPPSATSAPKTVQVIARNVVLHAAEQYSPRADRNTAGHDHATICSGTANQCTPATTPSARPMKDVPRQIAHTTPSQIRNSRTLVKLPTSLASTISAVVSGEVMRLVRVSRSRSLPTAPAARTATPKSISVETTTLTARAQMLTPSPNCRQSLETRLWGAFGSKKQI